MANELFRLLLEKATTTPRTAEQGKQRSKLATFFNVNPVQPAPIKIGGGWPDVPTPVTREPDPKLLGASPDVATSVYQILQQFPELKRGVKTIQVGPNQDYLNYADDFPAFTGKPELFAANKLLGMYAPENQKITLNPRVGSPELTGDILREILVHEFAHAGGSNEAMSREAEKAARALELSGFWNKISTKMK